VSLDDAIRGTLLEGGVPPSAPHDLGGIVFENPDSMTVTGFHSRRVLNSGLTILELLVVLVVLVAVAGIIVPNVTDLRLGFAGDQKPPQRIATEQTLMQVRAAILGTNGQKGLWQDLGERDADLPQTIAELFVPRIGWPIFDPNSRLGWRGPYLMSSGAQDAGSPAVLDGWGNPIMIQMPDAQHIRLVSKGEDGELTINPAEPMPALPDCGDDVVLFLRVADTRS